MVAIAVGIVLSIHHGCWSSQCLILTVVTTILAIVVDDVLL